MSQAKNNALPSGCQMIEVPEVTDTRGGLCFAEAEKHIPFGINRVFWIHDVPEGQSRGGHAHRTCAEVVFAVVGAFTMVVDDGKTRAHVRIDKNNEGILIPAGIWCELTEFDPGTVLVVMASHAYDATGYIHSYQNYLKENA